MKKAHKTPEGLHCPTCSHVTFLNSVAVAVLIAPCGAHESGKTHGVFIQKRGIEPARGEWALPSGYVMAGETWEAAACREAFEEINIVCRHEYSSLETPQHLLTENSSTKKQVVMVGFVGGVFHIGEFTPHTEVMERDIIFPDDDRQLCFPIHRRALAMYWEQRGIQHSVRL
jgi:8-oxo-dGTP pyrophosphatase MutT (NUDIX family)